MWLKTLEVMEKIVGKCNGGRYLISRDVKASSETWLKITISGLPALSSYTFNSDNALAYKTLITQQFLKYGYLAGTILYASNSHDTSKLDEYAIILNEIYSLISVWKWMRRKSTFRWSNMPCWL